MQSQRRNLMDAKKLFGEMIQVHEFTFIVYLFVTTVLLGVCYSYKLSAGYFFAGYLAGRAVQAFVRIKQFRGIKELLDSGEATVVVKRNE
jgi:hypothetical protein